jgi:hypothetical protein
MPSRVPRLQVQKSRRKARRRALPRVLTKNNAAIELLPDVPKNDVWHQMWTERIGQLAADRGHIDNCSTAEQILIKHCATLDIQLTFQTQRIALAGGDVSDLEMRAFQGTFGALRRGLEDLGLKRVAIPINGNVDGKCIEAEAVSESERIKNEISKRAFDGSDALLAQLYRSEEQKKAEERDVTKKFVVILDGEPMKP